MAIKTKGLTWVTISEERSDVDNHLISRTEEMLLMQGSLIKHYEAELDSIHVVFVGPVPD